MSRNRAFTLIELLVVIAIISLLVSILLPSLNRAKDLAKEVVCLTRQKQIGTAIMMYADDYGDYLVPAIADNYEDPPYTFRQHWFNLLSSYVGEQTDLGDGSSDTGYYDYGDVMICPVVTPTNAWSPGYGLVGILYGDINHPGDLSKSYENIIHPPTGNRADPYWVTDDGTGKNYRAYRRSELYRPEVRGWLTDSLVWHAGGSADDTYAPNYTNPQEGFWPHWDNKNYIGLGKDPERHGDRCNILFANGNARSLGYLVSGHAFWDIDNVPQ